MPTKPETLPLVDRREWKRRALAVRCWICKANPGAYCTSKRWKRTTNIHAGRLPQLEAVKS